MNDKKSLLFVTRRFPPSVGGMEQFAYDLQYALKEKTNLHLLSFGGRSLAWLILVIPWFFLRSTWILSTRQIDVIHMQDGVLSILGFVLKLLFRKPLVVVIHGLDITFNNPVFQTVVPWILKNHADRIICISNAAAREVIRRGINEEKVFIIPLGVTDDFFLDNKMESRRYIAKDLGIDIDDATTIIFTLGRIVKRKGVDWFIRNVCPETFRLYPQAIFIICGDGDYRDTVESSIESHGLQESIFIMGYVSNEFRNNIYNAGDIFVMPNIPVDGDMEGFGRVLIEASLCQAVVIASGIEGIVDAIHHNKNGILVDPKNEQDYLSTIGRFIQDKRAALEFGEHCRAYSLNTFSWDVITDQYLEVYENLISEP